MFEKDLPGKNTTGFGTADSDIGKLPTEVCETINGSWGFNLKDRKHKSKKELVQYLIKAAGYGSNLLLNVGPMPNGKIQPKHVQSLKEIGEWLHQNGETIYGTKAGIIPPDENWVSTQKGNTLYLHLLNNENRVLFIPEFSSGIHSIKLYHNKSKVKFEQSQYGLLLEIPIAEQNEIATIIEINLK
jgi:alpha-L-fucosidase